MSLEAYKMPSLRQKIETNADEKSKKGKEAVVKTITNKKTSKKK